MLVSFFLGRVFSCQGSFESGILCVGDHFRENLDFRQVEKDERHCSGLVLYVKEKWGIY
jgi:hypothetical protein